MGDVLSDGFWSAMADADARAEEHLSRLKKPIDHYRFYTPEEYEARIVAGWEPVMLEYESLDGGVPEPSPYRIVYGWRRWLVEEEKKNENNT